MNLNHGATEPMEEVVWFSCDGSPIYGTLHVPSGAVADGRKTGVVFVSAGARSRRGPYRLYLRFARRLCRAGYPVLRYDPPGIGDSPGSVDTVVAYKKQFLDCTGSVIKAIDYLQETTGVERVAMVGLCGGAYSAMMAAASEPRIEFLVLASLPVQDVGDMSEQSVIDATVQAYLCRIFQWRCWYKFFTGKSHYDWLLRAVFRLFTGRYSRPKANRPLWEASTAYISQRRRLLIVFGTEDPLYPPFAKHYHRQLARLDRFHTCCRVHVIEGANHTFAQIRWQDELIEASLFWLDEVAPGGEGRGARGEGRDESRIPNPRSPIPNPQPQIPHP